MLDRLLDESLIASLTEKYQKTHKHPIEFGVVLYTDGGCHLNYLLENERVHIGSCGVHGYIYVLESTKVGAGVTGYKTTNSGYELKDNPMVDRNIPTSMAEYNEFLSGGYKKYPGREVLDIKDPSTRFNVPSFVVPPVYYFNIMAGLHGATNQVGEMVGFIKGFELIKRLQNEIPIKHVHVKSDSKYVLQRVERRFSDLENGWCNAQKQPLANVKYLKELSAILLETMQPQTTYSCEWIQGHADSFGNIQADALASKALVGATNSIFNEEISIIPAKGYWGSLKKNSTSEKPEHYLMVEQQWYYNTQTEDVRLADQTWPICLGTHDTIGQPNSEYGMSIVLLKERPLAFTRLIEMSKKLDRVENGFETHGVFVVPVNEVLKPVLAEDIEKYGLDYLKVSREPKTIRSLAKKDILQRIDPPECSLDHMRRFDNILQVIERVKDNQLLPHEILTDVTDRIYKVNDTGKKRKVELLIGNDSAFKLDVPVRTFDVNYVYRDRTYSITLTHGITAPKKRVFSGLKDLDIKVYILTSFEAFTGFRYYTIIHLSSGEWGIWTNPHANLRNI